MLPRRRTSIAYTLLLGLGWVTACNPSTASNPFQGSVDAALDAAPGGDAQAPDAADTGAPSVETGSRLGGPCLDSGQCDDGIDCTFDDCDLTLKRCRFSADDSRCADTVYCNGVERCDLQLGCRPGEPVTCSDNSTCTIDRCVEADHSCRHDPRDADGDGDVDHLCVANGDCDDSDPTVSSKLPEICDNGKDDNCDGTVDEADCERPMYDGCADPLLIQASGSYSLSTGATRGDYAVTCIDDKLAQHDLVIAVAAADGAPQDIDIVVTAAHARLALASVDQCGNAASETACTVSSVAPNGDHVARLRLRQPAPGNHAVYLFADAADTVSLRVDYLDPSEVPSNETCGTALPIEPSTPTLASLVQVKRDLDSRCGAAGGDLVYEFSLTEPQDARVLANSRDDYGVPLVSLRSGDCAAHNGGELTCRVGNGTELFARALPPGDYYIAVSATGPSDVDVVLDLSPPSSPPADETCAGAPALAPGVAQDVTLQSHTDDLQETCLPGAPDAAYDFTLARASDVLVVQRISDNDVAAVSLLTPGCGANDLLKCAVSSSTPVRVAEHDLKAGQYRIAAESLRSSPVSVTAFTRPASPPTVVAFADTCDAAVEIPEQGGFFQGNTANANADYSAGCDLPAQGPGGAADQMLKLSLNAEKRVILDMQGSAYATLLDVRSGPDCPGTEVANGCSVGASSDRSYLDLTLPKGEYFIQVDGFARDAGLWFLDVYVVDP